MSGCGSPWNRISLSFFSFFFNDTATTEIYTLSLHDALPISPSWTWCMGTRLPSASTTATVRSEEHTSELQSRLHLVCRLLLEKKKTPEIPKSCQWAILLRHHDELTLEIV